MRHPLRGAPVVLACAGLAGLWACVSLDSPAVAPTCSQVGTLTVGVALADSITSAAAASTWLTDSGSNLVANSTVNQAAATTQTLRLIVAPGPYELAVNSFAKTPSGAMTVTVAKDTTPVAGSTTAVWVTNTIATTQTITSGDHTDGPNGTKYYYHLYLRWVPGGTLLTLSEHSTAFSPSVTLTSLSSGSAVSYSSLDSTNTNAVLTYTPAQTDILLVWVGAADSLQGGKYTLTIK